MTRTKSMLAFHSVSPLWAATPTPTPTTTSSRPTRADTPFSLPTRGFEPTESKVVGTFATSARGRHPFQGFETPPRQTEPADGSSTTLTASSSSHASTNLTRASRTPSSALVYPHAATSSSSRGSSMGDGTSQAASTHAGDIPDGATAAIAVGVVLILAACAYAVWRIQRRPRAKVTTPDFSSLDASREHGLPMDDLYPNRSATPPSIDLETWLAYHGAGDARLATWSGVHSPSPKPAMAEVQCFTRTQQRPRVYNVRQPTLPSSRDGSLQHQGD